MPNADERGGATNTDEQDSGVRQPSIPEVAQCNSAAQAAVFSDPPVWTPNHSDACFGGVSPTCADAADWWCIQQDCDLGDVFLECIDAFVTACQLSGPCARQLSGYMCCMEETCPPWPSSYCGSVPEECATIYRSATACLEQRGSNCEQRAWEACRAADCDDSLCLNGGTCDDSGDCLCNPAYAGIACERRQRYATYPIPSPPHLGMPHPMSYEDGDGISLDLVTGLMWQRESMAIYGRNAAVKTCESLELAGYDDWRMPNLMELLTLADSSHDYGMDLSRFPSSYPRFWSISYRRNAVQPIIFDYPSHTWVVSTSNQSLELRCVRDTRALAVEVAPPEHWYLKNGSVFDDLTGLEWTPSLVSVGEADQQRRACNSVRLGGHADWRLPRLAELATLLDEHAPDDADMLAAPFERLARPFTLMTSERVPAGAPPGLYPDLLLDSPNASQALRRDVGALCVRDATSDGIKVDCDAPLPTGFCLVSPPPGVDTKSVSADAPDDVALLEPTIPHQRGVGFVLTGPDDTWTVVEVRAPYGQSLQVGTYDLTEASYLTQGPRLSVRTESANCAPGAGGGSLTISELEFDMQWTVVRFAARFKYQCSQDGPLSYGAIHYNATGIPDPIPREGDTIRWQGSTSRLTYDPDSNRAYGFDTSNRRIITLDLQTHEVTYARVMQAPLGGCVNPARRKLFVVNQDSSIISEYTLQDITQASATQATQADWLSAQREINWGSTTPDPSKIHCTQDGLYLVEGSWERDLWSVVGLQSELPRVTNHAEHVSAVSALGLDSTGSNLYFVGGDNFNSVSRVSTTGLGNVLDLSAGIDNDERERYMPILLDETRDLLFTRHVALTADDLTRLVFTFLGEREAMQALDVPRGRVASQYQACSVDTFERLAQTITATADQMFFDRDGVLRFLVAEQSELRAQILE